MSYQATVLDCEGHPVMGTVTFHEIYGVDGFARSRNACVRSLDSTGRFSCDKLAAGRYGVVFSATDANAPSPDALPTPLMPRETLEAGPIQVSGDGQNQKHTFHVCASAAKPITASIPDRPPASFLNLAFRTPEGDLPTGVSPVYDSESGKVLMPALAPGTYHLQAYWFANGADKRYDRILRVPEDIPNELALEQTAYSVSGSIHMDGGTSTPPGMIVAASCGQFGSMVRRRQLVGSDGSFTFRRLNGPECTFSVTGPGAMSLVTMEVNDKPIEYGQTRLEPAPGSNQVNLTASANRTSLSGHVDGRGVEAGVSVVACSMGSGECHVTKTAADATFRFADLPVGFYRVSAWKDLDRVEYRVPAFLRPFAASNAEIHLNANQAAEVSVSLSHSF
jgi:hypothetical protein